MVPRCGINHAIAEERIRFGTRGTGNAFVPDLLVAVSQLYNLKIDLEVIRKGIRYQQLRVNIHNTN